MTWQDILKEFKPDTTKGEYFQALELLDYIITNYPNKGATELKKEFMSIIDRHYEKRNAIDDNTINQLNNLTQYVTRGESNTLRDTWDDIITALNHSI